MAPWLVPVGGFLGAGKTTLILEAARMLEGQGVRSAAILNDQGGELVDTLLAGEKGLAAGQVTGGCFCCRFSDLMEAAERLRAHHPGVIFAEPVGSCTDLAATILRPLLQDYSDRYRLAPLTVLIDPAQAFDLLRPEANPDLAFLFRHQLSEADLLCFTKCDTHQRFPPLPGAAPRYLSARTGQGVAEWLREVLSGALPSGAKPLELDYERYARAEAALGWLNWRATLRLRRALTPAMVIGPLLDDLDASLTAAGLRIVHVKVLDRSPSGYLKAALTRNGEEPMVDGPLDASPALRHEILINLRAVAEPERLRQVVLAAVARLPGKLAAESLECFRPAAPAPERRVLIPPAAPPPGPRG